MRFLLPFVLLFFAACGEDASVPKPRAYPRVVYPEKGYQPFDESYCNFVFEQPRYAVIEKDSTFFDEKVKSDCWFNVDVPSLNAKIYCSYYPITGQGRFDELVQDAFVMAQKHNIKSSYIENIRIERPADKVYGIVFDIQGPAASPYQFFLTDSTRHFLRGALYFRTQARPDSLAPVIAFMKEDVNKIITTLRWKQR